MASGGLYREELFFETEDKKRKTVFVLIIYDITDNKVRYRLSKFLEGFGFRVQKSAFEAFITPSKYKKLIKLLPGYVTGEDSIRVYKIVGAGQVTNFGYSDREEEQEEVIVI